MRWCNSTFCTNSVLAANPLIDYSTSYDVYYVNKDTESGKLLELTLIRIAPQRYR